MEKAVIDRFEDEWAILLVGEKEERLTVRRKELPKEAREGHWLKVELDGDVLLGAELDEEETARMRARIMDKLTALRRGEHREDAAEMPPDQSSASERASDRIKRSQCPFCGSERCAEILYGRIAATEQLQADLAAGKVVLGGCLVHGKIPRWRCLDCGKEWRDGEE